MHKIISLSLASVFLLTACETPQIYSPTQRPDYSIRVAPDAQGKMTAIAPGCPSWASSTTNPYDNQPLPQHGCATARNLAMMIEKPEDLVHGRPLDDSSGVMAVGAMRRYYNNQTRGLIYPSGTPDTIADTTTAPTGNSSLTGDATGGGSSSGSSSSSSSAVTP